MAELSKFKQHLSRGTAVKGTQHIRERTTIHAPVTNSAELLVDFLVHG